MEIPLAGGGGGGEGGQPMVDYYQDDVIDTQGEAGQDKQGQGWKLDVKAPLKDPPRSYSKPL